MPPVFFHLGPNLMEPQGEGYPMDPRTLSGSMLIGGRVSTGRKGTKSISDRVDWPSIKQDLLSKRRKWIGLRCSKSKSKSAPLRALKRKALLVVVPHLIHCIFLFRGTGSRTSGSMLFGERAVASGVHGLYILFQNTI